MNEKELVHLAETVIASLKQKGLKLAAAESCTGGLLSKIITDVSGASAAYLGGVCSYANEVKIKLLGVSAETLAQHGAVSEQTAVQMANGVVKATGADIGVSVTGIAGPLSDNTQKPVGLIYISAATPLGTRTVKLTNTFTDNVREQNRFSAVETALRLISEEIDRL